MQLRFRKSRRGETERQRDELSLCYVDIFWRGDGRHESLWKHVYLVLCRGNAQLFLPVHVEALIPLMWVTLWLKC